MRIFVGVVLAGMLIGCTPVKETVATFKEKIIETIDEENRINDRVTGDNVLKLQPGISREEVISILGKPNSETRENPPESIGYMRYKGSEINVLFRVYRGKMGSKVISPKG